MPDARGQNELRSLALLAVRDIAKAIDAVNREAGRAMVVWPLDIRVVRATEDETFDFAELHAEATRQDLLDQAKEGE